MSGSHPNDQTCIRWSEIQDTFNNVDCDCLLLLDCFNATRAGTDTGKGMFNDLPARIHLLAGSGDVSETNLPVGPSFTTTMAKVMSEHIERRNCVDMSELYVELSKRMVHLHTIPFRFNGDPSEHGLLLRKLRAPRRTEWKLGTRRANAEMKSQVAPLSSELGPLSGGGDLSHTLIQPLHGVETKHQSSASESDPLPANTPKVASRVAAKPTRQIYSDSGGHLADIFSHPTAFSPTDGKTRFEYRFSQRLIEDLGCNTGLKSMRDFPRSELVSILRGFAGRLHEEATTSSDWKLSVALHRKSE